MVEDRRTDGESAGQDREPLSYEQARERASDADWRLRRDLAGRPDTPAEVLFFLCADAEPRVRTAVAGNAATPVKGNLVLAGDADADVRRALAGKIARDGRMAGATPDQARPREIMDQALTLLAADPLAEVRAGVAEALKDAADVDAGLVARLAGDPEIAVARPLLEWSPLLDDDFLLTRIAGHPGADVLEAIARRAFLDSRVTEAIVAAGDAVSIAQLLRNDHATLQEDTLDVLIDSAATEPSWQEPLVCRPELSEQALDRVVEMVSASVLDRVSRRGDLPPQTAAAVSRAIAESLRAGASGADRRDAGGADPARSREWARSLRQDGRLDETALLVALLSDRQEDVAAGLALLAGVGLSTVREIRLSQSPLALCSLARAAGLSAGFAVDLQLRFGAIAPDRVRRPAADGGYAFDPGEMDWHLDMFRASQGAHDPQDPQDPQSSRDPQNPGDSRAPGDPP